MNQSPFPTFLCRQSGGELQAQSRSTLYTELSYPHGHCHNRESSTTKAEWQVFTKDDTTQQWALLSIEGPLSPAGPYRQ